MRRDRATRQYTNAFVEKLQNEGRHLVDKLTLELKISASKVEQSDIHQTSIDVVFTVLSGTVKDVSLKKKVAEENNAPKAFIQAIADGLLKSELVGKQIKVRIAMPSAEEEKRRVAPTLPPQPAGEVPPD